SVSEVLSIPEGEIVDPPEVNKTGNRYIKGIGKVDNEMKLILDCYRLLNDRDKEKLDNSLLD
ncbi:chemotaxis protein CheW, partial [Clostridioides difficile]|nr:chemotaxis protein CheW [Clostridioides difficile]